MRVFTQQPGGSTCGASSTCSAHITNTYTWRTAHTVQRCRARAATPASASGACPCRVLVSRLAAERAPSQLPRGPWSACTHPGQQAVQMQCGRCRGGAGSGARRVEACMPHDPLSLVTVLLVVARPVQRVARRARVRLELGALLLERRLYRDVRHLGTLPAGLRLRLRRRRDACLLGLLLRRRCLNVRDT